MLPVVVPAPPDLIAAGLILRRLTARGSRWLLLRASKHGEWGFPKGHQEHGETLLETALRECAEETGIGLLAIENGPLEIHYAIPGRRQKRTVYFPALTACHEIHLSREHSAGAWFTDEEVLDLLEHANLRSLFKASQYGLDA
jgi:8-oxo-dGTP pyrophosphatase MutT (NUDIX family)